MLKTVLVASLSIGVYACLGQPVEDTGSAQERCELLRDHLVELRIGTVRGIDSDLAQHRAGLKQALGATFTEHCMSDLSVDQLTCSIHATSLAAVSACSSEPPTQQ